MGEQHLLTLVLLFLAHLIGDWSALTPFDKEIVDAKTNGEKRNFWLGIHSLIMATYKIIAILLSHTIIPINGGFVVILVIFFFVEFFSHFILDLLKCIINEKFQLNPNIKFYWTAIGIDQFVHAIIMFIVCYYLYS